MLAKNIQLWVGNGIQFDPHFMSIVRSYGSKNTRKTMKGFAMACFFQFMRFFSEKNLHVYPQKDRNLCGNIETGISIRMEFT